MKAENFNVEALLRMAHSPVGNYVIPGLTSYLIGERSERGTVRLFHCSREHQEPITPHSHRFDFQCWVLRGSVRNRIWTEAADDSREADTFQVSTLNYRGEIGKYSKEPGAISRWCFQDHAYSAGECYSMTSDEVHSIFFSRNALVLFFEGPTVAEHSMVLEPFVEHETIPTMETKPWMFRRQPALPLTAQS